MSSTFKTHRHVPEKKDNVRFLLIILPKYIYINFRFTKDIEDMTGYRPGWYWQITWRFLAPLIMVAILITSVSSMIINKPTYPAWNSSLVRKNIIFFHFIYVESKY